MFSGSPIVAAYDRDSGIDISTAFWCHVKEDGTLLTAFTIDSNGNYTSTTTVNSAGNTTADTLSEVTAMNQTALNSIDTTGWNRCYVYSSPNLGDGSTHEQTAGGTQKTSSSVGQYNGLYLCCGNATGTSTPTDIYSGDFCPTTDDEPNKTKIIMVVKDHSGWGSKKYINFGLDAEAPVVSTIL